MLILLTTPFTGYIFDNNGCVGLTFENRTWADSNAACQEADAHMFYVLDKSYQDVLERNIQASYMFCTFFVEI